MTWWMPEHPADPGEPVTWEHVFIGTGPDCYACHEGNLHFLHIQGKMPYCTICLVFTLLRPAQIAFTRPTGSGYVGVPMNYCAEHAHHAPLVSWLVNAWLHAECAGDFGDGDDGLLEELLAAYDAA